MSCPDSESDSTVQSSKQSGPPAATGRRRTPWAASAIDSGSRSIRTLSDRPIIVGLATGTGGLLFVLARLLVAAHGDVTLFIVVGSAHSNSEQLLPGIAFVHGNGYDGQFYYRIALDPGDLARDAFGLRMDTVSRFERIGYPTIAWVLAGGRHSLVPDSLVATNVLAMGALGVGGALMARDSGRHAMWGAVLAGYWGYLWSAGRDLTEITAAAFLVFGLYAFRRSRWLLAGFVLLCAVLTKETATYVVAVLAVTRLVGWVVKRNRPVVTVEDVAWAMPLIGFAAWQLVVLGATGSVPLLSSGQSNLGVPFVGMIDGFRRTVDNFPATSSLLWLGELAVLIVLAVAAGRFLRESSAPLHERLAWIAVIILAVSAANGIWLGDVGFRSLDDVYLFSWLVLLGTSRRLWFYGGVVVVTWLVVAVELVRFI